MGRGGPARTSCQDRRLYRTVLAACAVVALVLVGLLVAATRAPADVRLVGIRPSADGSTSTDHVASCVGDVSEGGRRTQWAVAVTIENRSSSRARVLALHPDATTGLRDVQAWVRPVGDPGSSGGGVVGRVADYRDGQRLRPAVGATLGPHERRRLVVGMRVEDEDEDEDGGIASGWSAATAGPFGIVRSQPLGLDLGVTGAVADCAAH